MLVDARPCSAAEIDADIEPVGMKGSGNAFRERQTRSHSSPEVLLSSAPISAACAYGHHHEVPVVVGKRFMITKHFSPGKDQVLPVVVSFGFVQKMHPLSLPSIPSIYAILHGAHNWFIDALFCLSIF